jgi:Holliday junction resolvase RusA-like endonuclease
MRYELTIFGQPAGKARHRWTRRGGFHTYNPQKTQDYEELVKYTFKSSYPNAIPLEDAVRVEIAAYYQIPKSYSKKKKQECLYGHIQVQNKPDCDNIAKIILDSLNGYAYIDDKQVVELHVTKMWSDMPRVEVYIEEV